MKLEVRFSQVAKRAAVCAALVLTSGSLGKALANPGSQGTATRAQDAAAQHGWSRVEPKRVCMVTNAVFPKDQIPVQVSGKTYYGCCENCKKTLAEDDSVRFGVDPVSQKKVDKATALIAAGPDGGVLYFENEGSFQKFLASGAKAPQ